MKKRGNEGQGLGGVGYRIRVGIEARIGIHGEVSHAIIKVVNVFFT